MISEQVCSERIQMDISTIIHIQTVFYLFTRFEYYRRLKVNILRLYEFICIHIYP